MTVTTPPTDPGGRPASDRWVTIFAACSVLCTVVALVCLGLLVFTGDDKGSGSSTTSSGTNNADSGSGTGDDGSSEAASSSETGACDIAQLQHAQTVGSGYDSSKMGEIHFCDGRWANIYMWGSGFQSDLLEWNGTEWERRKSDGKSTGGLDNPCYDEDKLKADGVPYGEDDLKLVVCGTNAIRPNPDE